jgi:adenylosuccinate synthase
MERIVLDFFRTIYDIHHMNVPETNAEYKEAQDFESSEFVVSLEQFKAVECENNELKDWKSSALEVLNKIQLQKDLKKELSNVTDQLDCAMGILEQFKRERDEAVEALMKIEEVFVDGENTYEDWRTMGNIAREALEKQND